MCVSNSVGAKLRGGEGATEGIEVKKRQERKKRGAELWDKVQPKTSATALTAGRLSP